MLVLLLLLLLFLIFRAIGGNLISVMIEKGRSDSWHGYGKEVRLRKMSRYE